MENKIKTIMGVVFNIDIERISDDASPSTIEEWDSLKLMDLVVSLEDEFEIEFTDDEITELLSFKLICEIIQSKLND